ncbi:MAG: Uncharacterized protein G01um101424_95 [Parcubacteria group bacterium Gr01-1014_24]|nr:MAG: Uncharacterized protein G01um101424_95 [Parcubacteria group bacterium Gr01-1014_24]
MIYLFSGDDSNNKLRAYQQFSKSIPKSTEIFFVNRNDFNKMQIESLYSGSGLFFAESAVIFSNIFEYEETRDFILEKLELMSKSANSFIFLEGKLNKPILDAFKRVRAELNTFLLPKEKKEKFDNFLVANAFSQKNKLNLWIYFRQAIDKGVGMEELIGVLFWKIKDMLLKRDFRKFSEAELKNSASRLSYLLPQTRKKGLDAESAFEQFLLEAFKYLDF